MVSVIIRCLNRLEYTTQCLSSLYANNNGVPFEVIVVNQASTDGTKEWLDWIATNPNTRKYYKNLKIINLDRNVGDFGGMLEGFKHISKDSKYVCQLDNDIVFSCGLKYLTLPLDGGQAKVTMLKRKGVKGSIAAKNPVNIYAARWGEVPFAVACWMTHASNIKIAEKHQNTRSFTAACGKVLKCLDNCCTQLQGYGMDGKDSYLQHDKYGEVRHLKKRM